jgi:hypothetical protein
MFCLRVCGLRVSHGFPYRSSAFVVCLFGGLLYSEVLRIRNAAVHAMAVALGIPRGKCYYYMVAFEHAKVSGNASQGLGSDNSGIAKDCGYFFSNERSVLQFRSGGPFRDVRRHRCVNNVWYARLFPRVVPPLALTRPVFLT